MTLESWKYCFYLFTFKMFDERGTLAMETGHKTGDDGGWEVEAAKERRTCQELWQQKCMLGCRKLSLNPSFFNIGIRFTEKLLSLQGPGPFIVHNVCMIMLWLFHHIFVPH